MTEGMNDQPPPAKTRHVNLVVALSSVAAVVVNLVTATWIIAGYHYQFQDQNKRVVVLEADSQRRSDTVTEINIRLARIEERQLAGMQNMSNRKNQ